MSTEQPETRYAKSGDVYIAYQVMGQGPIDLVFVPGFVSHVEANWQTSNSEKFFRRLASFSRLILFDKRGTGLSDRSSQLFTLEQRMDDVRVVMDAVGSERAAVFGISEGGPMSILFASTYPERTTALVRLACVVASGTDGPALFGRVDECRDAGIEARVTETEKTKEGIHARSAVLSGRSLLSCLAWQRHSQPHAIWLQRYS